MKESEYLAAREKLSCKLGTAASDHEWDVLRGHYDDQVQVAWVVDDDESWEDLVRNAKAVRAAASGKSSVYPTSGRPSDKERVAASFSAYEKDRSEVFSGYLAAVAASSSTARRFSSRVLDGGLLSPEQARSLLWSPFAALYPSEWFRAKRVSITEHSHRVAERGEDGKGSFSQVETLSSQKRVLTLKDRRPLDTGPWVIPGRAHRAREIDNLKRELNHPTRDYKILPFPGEDGDVHRALIAPSSVLGSLYKSAHTLLRHYPWPEEDATWFLLTGETPYVAPATYRGKFIELNPDYPDGHGYGFITLTVEPWISAATVEQLYRDIQRQWLKGDNRPVGKKSRRLVSFVTRKVGSVPSTRAEKRKVGRALVDEWNQECSQGEQQSGWAYRGTGATRAFWRDYNSARKRIASPEYKIGEPQ